MATTKTTPRKRPDPQPRNEQEILAKIYELAQELKQRDAQNLIKCAVQEIRDRYNGKDAF